METGNRGAFHMRSNSSPDPLSEPWAESIIPSSVSLMTPCTGSGVDPTCGLAEALEAILPFETNYDDDDDDHAFTRAGSAPTVSAMTPNKISSDNLCAAQDASKVEGGSSPSTTQDSPATTPTYQKRGRFLVWPVKMESPQLSLPLFGLARR